MAAGDITEAEVRSLIESVLLSEGAGADLLDTFIAFTVQVANNSVAQVRDLFAAEIAASIAGVVEQELLDAAQETILADTKTLITNLIKTELQTIANKIDEGVAAGLNPREIAKGVEELLPGLDSVRQKQYEKYLEYLDALDITPEQRDAEAEKLLQQLMADRAETVARTEARKVTSLVAEADAIARDAKFKRWITRGDERVSDICQSCEAQGVIPIKDSFAGGVARPPAHPNCRCTVAYLSDDPTLIKLQKQQAKDAAERTTAAKEEGEG